LLSIVLLFSGVIIPSPADNETTVILPIPRIPVSLTTMPLTVGSALLVVGVTVQKGTVTTNLVIGKDGTDTSDQWMRYSLTSTASVSSTGDTIAQYWNIPICGNFTWVNAELESLDFFDTAVTVEITRVVDSVCLTALSTALHVTFSRSDVINIRLDSSFLADVEFSTNKVLSLTFSQAEGFTVWADFSRPVTSPVAEGLASDGYSALLSNVLVSDTGEGCIIQCGASLYFEYSNGSLPCVVLSGTTLAYNLVNIGIIRTSDITDLTVTARVFEYPTPLCHGVAVVLPRLDSGAIRLYEGWLFGAPALMLLAVLCLGCLRKSANVEPLPHQIKRMKSKQF